MWAGGLFSSQMWGEGAERERAPRFYQSLWRGVGVGVQKETLFLCPAREKGFGRRGGHLSGPAGRRGRGERSGAPRGGSPAAAARASRPGLGVSGSSMATRRRRRRRATPLTPHFQIKMAQAPGPRREAGPRSSRVGPEGYSPHGSRETRSRAGTPFPAWKGLGRRKGKGCSRGGGGGGVQPWTPRDRPRKTPRRSSLRWRPPSCQRGAPAPSVGGVRGSPPQSLQLLTSGWEEGARKAEYFLARSQRGDGGGVGGGGWGSVPRPSPAGRGQRGVGGQGKRRSRSPLSWDFAVLFPGALLPEKVSMAFIAQCSSGQSTKA